MDEKIQIISKPKLCLQQPRSRGQEGKPRCIDRRVFLTRSLLTVGGIAGSTAGVQTSVAEAMSGREKALILHSLHTGEKLQATYWANGAYVPEALREIGHLLRDWRTNQTHPIDPALLDYLFDLCQRVNSTAPFQVVSGYRSPKTNAMLASRRAGVAKRSLHMRGKAIDVFLPGRELAILRRAALSLKRGGLGYYPLRGFIHLDTGRVRAWKNVR